jgi:ribosomal protein S18 acetylase RimI-like enzyme
MTQFTVRRLVYQDAEQYRVIRLHGLLHDPVAFGGCHTEESSLSVERFAAQIVHAANIFFGAFAGDEIIGCVALTNPTAAKMQHKATLWGMYTMPQAQGLGVGYAMMQHLLHYAQTQTAVERILLQVTASNTRASQWYERLGFKLYGIEYRAVKFADRYDNDELRVLELARPRVVDHALNTLQGVCAESPIAANV